jgi:hypothetical protein
MTDCGWKNEKNIFKFNVTEGVFQFQPMMKLSCEDDR